MLHKRNQRGQPISRAVMRSASLVRTAAYEMVPREIWRCFARSHVERLVFMVIPRRHSLFRIRQRSTTIRPHHATVLDPAPGHELRRLAAFYLETAKMVERRGSRQVHVASAYRFRSSAGWCLPVISTRLRHGSDPKLRCLMTKAAAGSQRTSVCQ